MQTYVNDNIVVQSEWSQMYYNRDVSKKVTIIVGLRPPAPPVVPTFFLLVSFTFLFEDFYYSVKEYKKISVCCSSG